MTTPPSLVGPDVVESTLELFAELDKDKDEASMQAMATRLGREQPAVLEHAAAKGAARGERAGQAAVFYTTLVWRIFDRHAGRELPRVTTANMREAGAVIEAAYRRIAEVEERAISDRVVPELEERQPHLVQKLRDLIAEDVRSEALTAEIADAVYPLVQGVVEAFDGVLEGRRPGINPVSAARSGPKVGRNEPCPCGSGKKYKRCCAH